MARVWSKGIVEVTAPCKGMEATAPCKGARQQPLRQRVQDNR